MPNQRASSLSMAWAIAVPALLATTVIKYGPVQFDGYDGAIVTSSAWQLHLGYRPYTEVITATPPVFLEGAHLAFALFGPRWISLVWMTAIFVVVTYGVHVWLLRRAGLPRGWAVAVASLTQLCTSVPLAWWWYNTTTETLACLFLAAVAAWRGRSRLGAAATILLGALLLLVKANVGPPLLAMAFLFLILRHGWIRVTGAYLAMVACALSLLGVLHIPLGAMLRNYHALSGRALSRRHIVDYMLLNGAWEVKQTALLLLPALLGLLVMIAIAYRAFVRRREESVAEPDLRELAENAALLLISFASCLLSTATNNTFNFSELPVLICGAALFLRSLLTRTMPGRSRTIAMACIAVAAIGLGANAFRITVQRLATLGAGPFYQNVSLQPVPAPAFFDHVQAGPELLDTVQDLNAVFQDPATRHQRVFIGPRIEFAYPAYGIAPCRGLPVWWEGFSNPRAPMTQEIMERFKREDFELLVFLKDDFTYMPGPLVEYVKTRYTKTETATLMIYRPR